MELPLNPIKIMCFFLRFHVDFWSWNPSGAPKNLIGEMKGDGQQKWGHHGIMLEFISSQTCLQKFRTGTS